MEKKEKLKQDLKKFFDAEVLREIYSSDYFSICNVSNCCYAVFDYASYDQLDTPCAFVLSAQYIEEVMQNNDLFYRWIASIPSEKLPENIINCTDRIFEVMKQKKAETDKHGPKIELDYEKELIEKYGSKSKNR